MGEWRALIKVPRVEQLQGLLASHPEEVELLPSPEGFYLHSAALDAIGMAPGESDMNALDEYARLIRRINGLGRIQFGSDHKDVELRQLTRVENDRAQFAVAMSNFVGPVRPAAEEMPLSLPEGLPVLRANPALAEAVEAYGRAQSMEDLYGVYEILRKDVAGSQAVIDKWAGGKPTRDRFTWSAQQKRHARPSEPPPENPMGDYEAHAFIRKLLRTALDLLAPE